MYIVYANNKKHSAWNTREEANHQCDVLINYGYREGSIYIDDLDCNYENGHYFV